MVQSVSQGSAGLQMHGDVSLQIDPSSHARRWKATLRGIGSREKRKASFPSTWGRNREGGSGEEEEKAQEVWNSPMRAGKYRFMMPLQVYSSPYTKKAKLADHRYHRL